MTAVSPAVRPMIIWRQPVQLPSEAGHPTTCSCLLKVKNTAGKPQIFPSHEVFVLLLRPNIRPGGQNQKNVEFWTLNYVFISFTFAAITSSPALLISFTDSACLRSKSAACGPCFKMSGTEPRFAMNAARNPSWLRQTPHAA